MTLHQKVLCVNRVERHRVASAVDVESFTARMAAGGDAAALRTAVLLHVPALGYLPDDVVAIRLTIGVTVLLLDFEESGA